MRKIQLSYGSYIELSMLMAATALAKDKLPETSHDGLKLQKDTKLAAVYLKPGEAFKGYDKVSIIFDELESQCSTKKGAATP